MAIEKEVLDQLLAGHDPQDVFGKGGFVDELKKVLSVPRLPKPTPGSSAP